MIYRDFQDVKLSALGMGAMRLPVVDGDDSKIDEAAAFAMVDEAMARGVNYYDTAWGYHNGNSELVMGKALARHPREKFYLATKFPGYDLSNMGKVEEIFEKVGAADTACRWSVMPWAAWLTCRFFPCTCSSRRAPKPKIWISRRP